jgi:hypothetical protein
MEFADGDPGCAGKGGWICLAMGGMAGPWA